ncbi:MAG TPA: heavy-metal-associated domain-containing protein [Candidatus Poseidoniaceae archaeon]|nr:MAG: heavy-metal-associated domain-containing protein [Euryarchaeota archaeon TMED141]DAC10820.1 MAG TPA: heavy-metal-associated domain-containing protein [Candidatus Poseidoniales archaeon]DAC15157.1 MAG TPA: heavy-metal-associated domain-containing protein [Candidatus Poseidoniales archaeon]HII18186.1 heavy-metal-associated domain-containing protein [Candidatus Poseidoniaceae archaeon]HII97661.1 heavy-metal-associated domain-containing protein [Candidatus Poseidoniaceae archaeon]
MPTLGLTIVGMTCGCCSGRVKRVLEARQDVRSALIDHDVGRGLVEVAVGTDPNAIVQTVTAAGFTCSI